MQLEHIHDARLAIRFVTTTKYESNQIESYRFEFISLFLGKTEQNLISGIIVWNSFEWMRFSNKVLRSRLN